MFLMKTNLFVQKTKEKKKEKKERREKKKGKKNAEEEEVKTEEVEESLLMGTDTTSAHVSCDWQRSFLIYRDCC